MDTKVPVNILIAPLDWGIGHATRCVPIIRYFLERGFVPVLASSGKSKAFLEKEFPQLKCLHLPAYNVTYAGRGKLMAFKMLIQIPKILRAIHREHRQLKEIIKTHNIRLIISDNRYGLWHQSVPSVFITHQLMVKIPGVLGLAELISHKIIKSYILKYTLCFVPDFEGAQSLAGDLTQRYRKTYNTTFIGSISRFKPAMNNPSSKTWDVLVMLSGPEPQRSLFEKIIMPQIRSSNLKAAVLRGLPDTNTSESSGNVTVFSHLPTQEIETMIKKSRLIIARSGYSTIMDLVTLNAKAVLVPTPGQTEQIWLAQYHHKKGHFMCAQQHTFNLSAIWEKSAHFPYIPFSKKLLSDTLHPNAIDSLEKLLSNAYSNKEQAN